MADTHSVMPKKLAQALIEAGVKHFDSGGLDTWDHFVSTGHDPTASYVAANGGTGGTMDGIGGTFQDIGKSFTAQNNFQATNPGITTQNFGFIQGLQDQNQAVYNNQDSLARTLLAQSRGYGPNPAQAQLAQNTGQNVAAQGALMAGQRGASSNAGLMARQIAQQGAQTQQNSVGQAATLGAQQQLNNQQQLQNLYANQAANANQGQSIAQGAQAAQNSAITTGQLGSQQINANVAGQNAAANNATTGGIMGALGGGGASMLYKGGVVRKMADGGIASYQSPTNPELSLTNYDSQSQKQSQAASQGAKSGKSFGKYLKGQIKGDPDDSTATDAPAIKTYDGSPQYLVGYAEGGNVMDPGDEGIGDLSSDSTTSDAKPLMGLDNFGGGGSGGGGGPGGGPTSSMPAQGAWAPAKSGGGGGGLMGGLMALLSKGGKIPFSSHLLQGGKVPGNASVKGNNVKNDTEPTLLSPGEVVIPRSITMAKDAPERAAEFVRHLQAKKKGGYADVVSAKKSLKERVEHLEKLCGGGKV